jgi:hypothetical protein
LRRELDALRADQARRQQQIDSLQRRLDAFQADVRDAAILDDAVQAEIRGRGVSAPQPASGFVLHVGSYRSEEQAQAALADFRRSHAALTRDLDTSIQRVDMDAMGVWYRVVLGPFDSRPSASATCDRLKAAGAGCILGTVALATPASDAPSVAGRGVERPFDVAAAVPPSVQQEIRGRGAAPAQPTPNEAAPAGGESEEEVVREAGPSASVEAVTQSQQGIFGNRLSFEVGFS